MSLAAQAPDGTLHPLRKLLALLLVSVFTFSISGCGGGDASSDPEGESGGASDDLISQVEELISLTSRGKPQKPPRDTSAIKPTER